MPVRWYDIGTVACTAGATAVAGNGTAWAGQIRGSDLFFGPDDRPYEVASVESDTALTLRRPYRGATAAAGAYGIVRNFDASVAGDLTGRVSELVWRTDARDREWRNWLSGSKAGGPTGDGRYPLTDASGATRPVLCPEAWQAGASGGDGSSVAAFGGDPTGAAPSDAAFRAALTATGVAVVPPGVWRITAPIQLGYGQALIGYGDRSVIQAQAAAFDPVNYPTYPSDFNAVEMVDGYALIENVRIVGGASGIKMYGATGPCVKNIVRGVSVWDSQIGLVLDGYNNPNRPCYWNWVSDLFIGRPKLHGVLLTTESAGDTPNANAFDRVRVYSIGAAMTGCGFFLSTARFNTTFNDCEANVHPSAQACFRLGAITDETRITNFYGECSGAVPAIRIDGGSQRTSIINLFSATGGAPIWDTTAAGKYVCLNANAGGATRNKLDRTTITEARVSRQEWETDYSESVANLALSPARVVHLVSAYSGPVTATLAAAADCNGVIQIIKKTDTSGNAVTVTAPGSGPDAADGAMVLDRYGDHCTVVSNGAAWHVVAVKRATPVASWSPEGNAFTRSFNADARNAVGFEYDRNTLIGIEERLATLQGAFRALVLDLKNARVLN